MIGLLDERKIEEIFSRKFPAISPEESKAFLADLHRLRKPLAERINKERLLLLLDASRAVPKMQEGIDLIASDLSDWTLAHWQLRTPMHDEPSADEISLDTQLVLSVMITGTVQSAPKPIEIYPRDIIAGIPQFGSSQLVTAAEKIMEPQTRIEFVKICAFLRHNAHFLLLGEYWEKPEGGKECMKDHLTGWEPASKSEYQLVSPKMQGISR